MHPHDFADPFVWNDGRRYYATGTGRGNPASDAPGHLVFPLLPSDDLVHWRDAGRAMLRVDPALGDTCWAPEVAEHAGQWYLYCSVGFGDRRHRLRVAVAPHPLGPYVDTAQLTDPDLVPFAIDPHPFCDDGRWYLFHARDFLVGDDATADSTAPEVGDLQNLHDLHDLHAVPGAQAVHAGGDAIKVPAVDGAQGRRGARIGTALVVQPCSR